MKKLASILLLLSFGWFAFGYLMHTRLQWKALKREMRAQIRSGRYNASVVVTMRFRAQDFADTATAPHQVDKHEFRWQGKMYDVVSARFHNGQLVIRCIPDEEETQLLAQFLHYVKEKMGGEKSGSRQVSFSFWHFLNAQPYTLQPLPAMQPAKPALPLHIAFSSHSPGVPVPPPWLS